MLRPRQVIPAVLTVVSRIPAKTMNNVIRSLETRVLKKVAHMHPLFSLNYHKTNILPLFTKKLPIRTLMMHSSKVIMKVPLSLLKIQPHLLKLSSLKDMIIFNLTAKLTKAMKLLLAHSEMETDVILHKHQKICNNILLRTSLMNNYCKSALTTKKLLTQSQMNALNITSSTTLSNLCAQNRNVPTAVSNILSALLAGFMAQPMMSQYPDFLIPLKLDEWLSRYPIKRRRQFLDAKERVDKFGFFDYQTIIKCFLKIESSVKDTDPRNISPRSDEFLVTIGPYISALEHAIVKLPFLVKGLDYHQRIEKLTRLTQFDRFIEVDYSRYDMTLNYDLLHYIEHTLITLPFELDSFYQYFSSCLISKGISECGIKYKVRGTRCSGDAHTSIGNALINAFVTWSCLRKLPKDAWVMFVEGDDGIIGVQDNYFELAQNNLNLVSLFGLEAKIVPCNSINDATFVGSYFSFDTKLRMYSDPFRTLSKFHIVLSDLDPKIMIVAKSLSYLYLNPATPIITELCLHVIRNVKCTFSQAKRGLRDLFNTNYILRTYIGPINYNILLFKLLSKTKINPIISEEIRSHFCLRTGISPKFQIEYELYLRSLPYIPDKYYHIPGEFNISDESALYAIMKDLFI